MTDAPSVTTIVVGDQLPWPEDSWSAGEKGPFDPGAITVSGSRLACSIRKISALGVTVTSGAKAALGEVASVELPTGHRASGKVAWTEGRELGIRFDDSIDVIALLNRKLVSQARERRTMPRLELRCTVHLKCAGQFWPATLRNISARGLQIEGEVMPDVGAYVSTYVEGLNIPSGELIWKRQMLAGIELLEELSWTSIIPWVRGLVKRPTSSP
ncbi:MAG TPA: PilZ domain-containing protein [Sphingomicrobium sp.]|nr:PilZ domain-containing protein [Sphingomicrobium sp.]